MCYNSLYYWQLFEDLLCSVFANKTGIIESNKDSPLSWQKIFNGSTIFLFLPHFEILVMCLANKVWEHG